MALQSKLFRGDPKLEAATVSDPAHIMLGASGQHVQKIQLALILLDGVAISADEVQRTFYGTSTADAVLGYKRKRNIINPAYQTRADNIVGKMTMARLDREMLEREIAPHGPVRIVPKSRWVVRHPQRSSAALPALPHGARPVGLNVTRAFRTGLRFGSPALIVPPFPGSGSFDVIDGSPGLVEVVGPPIVKIQPAGVTSSAPGNSFPVTENPQTFTVLSGSQTGTTTIAANLDFDDSSPAAFLDVTVESSRLIGRIESAPDNALGFDTDQPISLAVARQFRRDGFRFCLRYLSFGGRQQSPDLTREEADHILDAGLALMPVQHVRNPGWRPTGALGNSDGRNAVSNANSVGFPIGMNVWMDLEGVDPTSRKADVFEYCRNWALQVVTRFRPGIYIGSGALLNSEQLFDLLFLHYWKAGGHIPPVAHRGYQMIQNIANETRHGIHIDRNTTQTDHLGGQVRWLIR